MTRSVFTGGSYGVAARASYALVTAVVFFWAPPAWDPPFAGGPPAAWGQPAASAQPRFRRRRDYRLEVHLLDDPSCPDEASIRDDAAEIARQEDGPFDPKGRHVIRVTVTKGKLYEAAMELFLPDGTRDPRTPVTYQAATCRQVTREATVAAVGFVPLDLTGGPAGEAECDEECIRERIEAARREGRDEARREVEQARERGRLEGRKEREREIGEELDKAIDRRLNARLPPPPGPGERRAMPYPFAVSAAGVISLGWALDVAPGIAIGAEWRPAEMFSLGLEARLMFPAKVSEEVGSEKPSAFTAGSFSGLVTPCLRWKVVVGCGVLEAGVVWLNKDDVTGFRVATGPRLGIDVPFAGRFSVRVLGDLLFPLPPGEYPLLDNKGEAIGAFLEPIVSGFVTAGLSVAF